MQVSEPRQRTIGRGFCAFLSLLCTELRQICGRLLHDFAERWSCGQAPFSFLNMGSARPCGCFWAIAVPSSRLWQSCLRSLTTDKKVLTKGVARITLSGDAPRSSHIRLELVGTNDLTSNRVNRHKYKHLLLKAISYPHLRRVGSLYCADLNCAYCSSRCSREPTRRVKIVTPAAKRPILIDGRNEAEVPEPVAGKVRELRARD